MATRGDVEYADIMRLKVPSWKVGDRIKMKPGRGPSGMTGKIVKVVSPPSSSIYLTRYEIDGELGEWLKKNTENPTGFDILAANSRARSRNAVVQKALNAAARNGAMVALDSSEKSKIKSIASGMPCSFMDGGDSLSGVIKHSKRPFLYIDFDVSKSEIGGKPYYEWYVHAWNRTRKWERNGGQYKIEDAVSAAAQAMRGAKQMIEKWSGGIPLNADTSVLRETAVNANASRVFKPGEKVSWEYVDGDSDSGVVVADKGSYLEVRLRDGSIEKPSKMLIASNASRSTNAVVAKALNASRKRNG